MPAKKLHLITAVVQQKVGNQTLNAALEAGATGATYYYAQGTGVRQAVGAADVEVDKRVILIATDPKRTDAVLKAVVETAGLSSPGQGFAYVQEVVKAVGFLSAASS